APANSGFGDFVSSAPAPAVQAGGGDMFGDMQFQAAPAPAQSQQQMGSNFFPQGNADFQGFQ
ncbi:unnamed protein product, partial [Polarella glacialis]